MSSASRHRGQILILIAAYLFFGGAASIALLHLPGASPRELKKAVLEVIADEPRRQAAGAVIDQWDKVLKAQKKAITKAREKTVKLVRRHDATRMDAEGLVATVDESIRGMDSSFLDARFGLREQFTRAEWEAAWARLGKD